MHALWLKHGALRSGRSQKRIFFLFISKVEWQFRKLTTTFVLTPSSRGQETELASTREYWITFPDDPPAFPGISLAWSKIDGKFSRQLSQNLSLGNKSGWYTHRNIRFSRWKMRGNGWGDERKSSQWCIPVVDKAERVRDFHRIARAACWDCRVSGRSCCSQTVEAQEIAMATQRKYFSCQRTVDVECMSGCIHTSAARRWQRTMTDDHDNDDKGQ